MAEERPPDSGQGYFCFISYRHKDNQEQDRTWASWLHQEIERYEVPPSLVGKLNDRGEEIPKRIYPVFRDEQSLAANAGLRQHIQEALNRSRFLLVLCSPRAVESEYVKEEIEYFQQLGRSERIITAIIEGEPGSPEAECFPEPLQNASANVNDGPLAADFRMEDRTQGYTSEKACYQALKRKGLPGREAKRQAMEYGERLRLMKLKIIAGLLGVSLDLLNNRDHSWQLQLAQQRARRARRVVGIVSTLAAIAVVLGIVAINRAKASFRARMDAEQLIAYMLTDLHDELKSVGRTEMIERLQDRVAKYYEDKEELIEIPQSVFLEAVASLQQSYNEEKQGKPDQAIESAQYALELLQILEEAGDLPLPGSHSDFRVATYQANALVQLAGLLEEKQEYGLVDQYSEEAIQLTGALVPEFPGNLMVLNARRRALVSQANFRLWDNRAEDALEALADAEELAKQVVALSPQSEASQRALARVYEVSSIAQSVAGQFEGALAAYEAQFAILQELQVGDIETDAMMRERIASHHFSVAMCYISMGRMEDAKNSLSKADEAYRQLRSTDPQNLVWENGARLVVGGWIDIALYEGDLDQAQALIEQTLGVTGPGAAKGRGDQITLMLFKYRQAMAHQLAGDWAEAERCYETSAEAGQGLGMTRMAPQLFLVEFASLPRVRCLINLGKLDLAEQQWKLAKATIESWEEEAASQFSIETASVRLALEQAYLDSARGEVEKASSDLEKIIKTCERLSQRYPAYPLLAIYEAQAELELARLKPSAPAFEAVVETLDFRSRGGVKVSAEGKALRDTAQDELESLR